MLRFLLDTGSTHTCLDKNALYIEQISLKEAVAQVEIETANGWILADVFNIESLEVLGLTLQNHPIQVIDFIAHGVTSNYSGILDMDVLRQKSLCFHFEEEVLTLV